LIDNRYRNEVVIFGFGGPDLPSISMNKLPLLLEWSQNHRLGIIKTSKSAKNAADFCLAFYAGLCHRKFSLEIPFMIVSNDKGFRITFKQLNRMGRTTYLIPEPKEVQKTVDQIVDKLLI